MSSRIALVTTSFPARAGDAAGHFVAAEATALARDGHVVSVIAPDRRASYAPPGTRVVRIEDGGAFGWPGALTRLRERPARALGALAFIAGARRALREHGPFDRVVAHWLLPAGWPIAADVDAALEIVAHGSDVRLLMRAPRALRKKLVAAWLERPTRFRFVSWELAETFARATDPALLQRAHVALPALDVAGAPARGQARAALETPLGARLLVVVGRLVPDKRVDVALAAALLVPEAEIVVVGDGPERPELERRFPSVRFVGQLPRDRALTWISAADLLLTASRAEGAPSVVREARALGVPVVSARAGDLTRWAESDPELFVVG